MRRFNAYIEAQKIRMKQEDENNWNLGKYVLSAVMVAVEHNLAGKKAKSKYIEKPFLHDAFEEESKQSIEMQRELYVKRLEARKKKFDLYHRKEEE